MLTEAAAALERDDPIAAVNLVRPLAETGNADAQHFLGFLYDLGLGVPFDPAAGTRWQQRAAGSGHYWASLYLAWKYRLGLGVESPDPTRAESLEAIRLTQPAPDRIVPAGWLSTSVTGFSPNFTRATRWLRNRVEASQGQAATTLAQYALFGFGGRPDLNQHLRWLLVAADLGDAAALERLSLYHETGLAGVNQSPALALDYLRRAAAAGLASAQYNLGQKYARGDDVAVDLSVAVDWYRRAAAQDHVAALNALANLLRNGIPPAGPDYHEALRLSQRAAALGDPKAMSDVASMLRQGRGADKDLAASFRFFRESAEKGYAYAAYMAGWMITHGEAGERDYAMARHWFDQAAGMGYDGAMREIGRQYAEGLGLPADQTQAFVWFERAAREGDDWSQNRLGQMLLTGTGIDKDAEEAASWFRLAIKQGYAESMTRLADLLRHGTEGVAKDLSEAFQLYRQAADKGNAYGAHMAGWMITYGEVGEKDYVEARRWFVRAVDLGHIPALTQIGLQYSEGRGVPMDKPEAYNWFVRAAEKGDDWAQNRVGWMLLEGDGVPADPAAAIVWFKKAAAQNNTTALANLGRCYENGTGTEQNLALAIDCFRKMLAAGQTAALSNLARVALKVHGGEETALLRELTPLIVARAPKAEPWELGPFAGVLMHNGNPLADWSLGRDLLDRLAASRRDASPPSSGPKLPVRIDP